jgi:hypothetical protein
MSANVVSIYRRMLRMVRGITPNKKREEALVSLRTQFRENAGVEDKDKIAALLTKANSSLGYLKMISPKTRGSASGDSKQSGRTRIVYGSSEGKSNTKVVSNWTGSNMDPDQVKRHYNQLKRAGFTDNSSVKGPMF